MRAGLSQHLQSPGRRQGLADHGRQGQHQKYCRGGEFQTRFGVDDKIIAAASCTTNAIVPVLKVSSRRQFGIEHGHMETVHAYTDDQNLHDNIHSKERRGRSAPLNMVLTESNATSAVGKLLPELAGKLTGNSIRVPVPNVSMAILNLSLSVPTTREELNGFLRNVSSGFDRCSARWATRSPTRSSRRTLSVTGMRAPLMQRQLLLMVSKWWSMFGMTMSSAIPAR